MEDGGALFDSRVIVEYVDTLSPVARLIPTGTRPRGREVWEDIADGLLDACVTIVKEKQRPEAQHSQNGLTASTAKIHASLDAGKAWAERPHGHTAAVAVGCRWHLPRANTGAPPAWPPAACAMRAPARDQHAGADQRDQRRPVDIAQHARTRDGLIQADTHSPRYWPARWESPAPPRWGVVQGTVAPDHEGHGQEAAAGAQPTGNQCPPAALVPATPGIWLGLGFLLRSMLQPE